MSGAATYVGTYEEIRDLIERHAKERDSVRDYFTAAQLRRYAAELRNVPGAGVAYGNSTYRVTAR
jgi:hypothetical protein